MNKNGQITGAEQGNVVGGQGLSVVYTHTRHPTCGLPDIFSKRKFLPNYPEHSN